jgi:hypothetical protein
MITTPSVSYAIDPSGGLDRWLLHQPGCTINSAVLGSSGALISQTCTKPDCSQRKFCGPGEQLLLRDATAGEETDNSKNNGNPDQLKWNLIGSKLVPVSADDVISALDPDTGKLVLLDAADGKTNAQLPLSTTAGDQAVAVRTNDSELIWTGGVTYALSKGDSAFAWSAESASPPTLTPASGDQPADLADTTVAVATGQGVAVLNPADGTPAKTFTIPPPTVASRVYPFWSGFLVTGPSTTLYR